MAELAPIALGPKGLMDALELPASTAKALLDRIYDVKIGIHKRVTLPRLNQWIEEERKVIYLDSGDKEAGRPVDGLLQGRGEQAAPEVQPHKRRGRGQTGAGGGKPSSYPSTLR